MEGNIYNQTNWICPQGEAFSHTANSCIPYDHVSNCNIFEKLKCATECSRIYFSSTGIAGKEYSDALGCFALGMQADTIINNTL